MRIRPRAAPPLPRRVPHPSPDGGNPSAAAIATASSPLTVAPVPALSPDATALTPATSLADSAVLPETGPSAGQNRTEEMLSYFHRPATPSGNGAHVDAPGADNFATGPAFLQAPSPAQSPEPAPLPPSRAIYHVVP